MSSLIYIGAFSFSAFGSADDMGNSNDIQSEIININTSWVDNDLLRIDVMFESGEISSTVINLSDYIGAENNAPFIEIQAVDSDGSQLGVVKISNPFYPDGLPRRNTETNAQNTHLQSGDGSLSAENDLISMLNSDEQIPDTEDENVTPSPTPDPQPAQTTLMEQDITSSPEAEDISPQSESEIAPPHSNNNAGLIIFIIILLAAAGGAAYYFLIYKRRNQYEEADDESDEAADYEYVNGSDDDDSEADEMYNDENPEEEDDE